MALLFVGLLMMIYGRDELSNHRHAIIFCTYVSMYVIPLLVCQQAMGPCALSFFDMPTPVYRAFQFGNMIYASLVTVVFLCISDNDRYV